MQTYGGEGKKNQEACKPIRRSLAFTDWWDLGYTAAGSVKEDVRKKAGVPRAGLLMLRSTKRSKDM